MKSADLLLCWLVHSNSRPSLPGAGLSRAPEEPVGLCHSAPFSLNGTQGTPRG